MSTLTGPPPSGDITALVLVFEKVQGQYETLAEQDNYHEATLLEVARSARKFHRILRKDDFADEDAKLDTLDE